jgi:phosphate transport system ATP-binding protein
MSAITRPSWPAEDRSPRAPEAEEDDDVSPESEVQDPKLSVRGLSAYFEGVRALRDIDMDIPGRRVTAIIGPSGCGKSTFLRCLNRMHEHTPGARVTGRVELDGVDVYDRAVDPVRLRRRVGMVFQKPNPFPTMSIRDNVLAGHRLNGIRVKDAEEVVERHLSQVTLWNEVKDKLGESGMSLSGGQQQRLCIARVLAVEPDVVLLDEPCSSLDPVATAGVEELMIELKERYTLVLVTHNMQQAARVSDRTAFFHLGSLVEVGPTGRIFTNPREPRTEDYVTGKFG